MSSQTTLDEHGRRVGHNEALFREVNERLRELNESFSVFSGVLEIVCECGNLECVEMLTLSPAEYERIRSSSTWFAVIPGHEIAEVEAVVAHHGGYDIVEKRLGHAVDEVVAHDPRS